MGIEPSARHSILLEHSKMARQQTTRRCCHSAYLVVIIPTKFYLEIEYAECRKGQRFDDASTCRITP